MKLMRPETPLLRLVVAMSVLLSPGVFADSGANDDLGVTMRMVTDDETLTDSVVREIRLTRPIGFERNHGPAADEVVGEAREQGRAFGQEAAERAREAGRLKNEVEKGRKPGRPDLDLPGRGRPDTGRPQIDPVPVTR